MKRKTRKRMDKIPSFVETATENAKEIAEIKNDTQMTIYKIKLTGIFEAMVQFVETKEYKRSKKIAPLIAYAFAVGWKEGHKNGNKECYEYLKE